MHRMIALLFRRNIRLFRLGAIIMSVVMFAAFSNSLFKSTLYVLIDENGMDTSVSSHHVISTSEPDIVGPKLVVLVTYQRSGSSFLGEIFNQNKKAYTWFEPIDGVYSALYGTEFGYNVPSDLWNMASGVERKLPAYEAEAIAEVSKNILTCEFNKLPLEVLAHHFVKMFLHEHVKMKPYHDCIEKDALVKVKQCNKKIATVCPKRFGKDVRRSDSCLSALLPISFPNIAKQYNITSSRLDDRLRRTTETYKNCLKGAKQSVLRCTPFLTSVCNSADIRAIKPVRFSMESGQVLLDILPNVRLIHNLRDPRGLAHSRSHTSESFQSLYAKTSTNKIDIVREALLFCRNAVKDVRLRKIIEEKHRGRTLQVVYENVASNPLDTASTVYSFMYRKLPIEVEYWLLNNTASTSKKQTQRNSKVTMMKWQNELTVAKMKEINNMCADLYEEINHIWQFS